MRLLAALATVVSLFAIAFAQKTWKDVTTLQIGVKNKPEECTRKTKIGDMVEFQYKGWLTDGTEFASSVEKGPLKFQLGEGDVIEGWEKGLLNMCVGEKRRLKIPATLGYRDKGHADLGIPADATLYFDTELMSVEDGPEVLHMDADSLMDLSEF